MKHFMMMLTCSAFLLAPMTVSAQSKEADVPGPLNFKMKSLDGKQTDLSDYKGKVVLMVNVASQCGATPQYAGLQDLHEKYQDQGLVVLGFPCNQFGAQEPGSADEIRSFCTKNYGVTFPMFAKINVNGDEAAPLYKFLTSKETNAPHAGPIGWNFEKFLISRDGKVVERFDTGTEPAELEDEIKKELAENP